MVKPAENKDKRNGKQEERQKKKTTGEKPISISPLNFKEALEGLQKVKPKDKPKKNQERNRNQRSPA